MINCKRYIILAGLKYQPRRWGEQYSHEFDTIEEALSWAKQLMVGYSFYTDWVEIIDMETKEVIFGSNPDWNNIQPKLRVKSRMVAK